MWIIVNIFRVQFANMATCVHFVLTAVSILLLTSSPTVICWELPTELHAKNDGNPSIYRPQTKQQQITSDIFNKRDTENSRYLRGSKRSNLKYRFGHMLDAAFNEHFDQIRDKHLVRQKRDSVFENHTSLFALLGGLLFFLVLGATALLCWWSRSCGVEKGADGEVPAEYETGARVFIANYNSGYENLAYQQEGRSSPPDTDSQEQTEIMETNIDQIINTDR